MGAKSSGETAYDALIAALRDGTFGPGDRLREEEVGAHLSLSRTPVREALRRLEAEGIVEHRPRLGAVIRRLSQREVVELYEMRIVFERTAAEMAARHGTQAEFDALDEINGRISGVADAPAQAAALNQSFHRSLYLACRNRFLLDAAKALNNALLLLGPTTFTDAQRIATVVGQHADIIAALRTQDEAAAANAAEAHLQTSLRTRLSVLMAQD